MRLTDEQIELYSRQIILREVGGVGQTALRAARVLVRGAGAASEACLSYLVGAGVGTVDLADARAPGDASVLALPEPARRTPDAAVGSLPRASDVDTHVRYDVALDLGAALTIGAASSVHDVGATSRIATRLGSIALHADRCGGLHLLLLPRDRGCPACTRPTEADDAPGASIATGAIAFASAGALAALVCCRWLLGIGSEDTARALTLPPGSGIWADGAPPTRTTCPRGCPPPAHPV